MFYWNVILTLLVLSLCAYCIDLSRQIEASNEALASTKAAVKVLKEQLFDARFNVAAALSAIEKLNQEYTRNWSKTVEVLASLEKQIKEFKQVW